MQDQAKQSKLATIWIFVEDLMLSILAPCRFDKSMTPEDWDSLNSKYHVELVTSIEGREEEFESLIRKGLEIENCKVSFKDLKELHDEVKKDPASSCCKIVLSDDLLGKQICSFRTELLSSEAVVLYMSLFTNNDSFVGIDYSKSIVGRAIGGLEQKLDFAHIKNRIKVGMFIDNDYYRPKMAKLLQDTQEVEFLPVSFHDVPIFSFDYVINRASVMQAQVELFNDPMISKCVENYQIYEEKNKKTVFIDNFNRSKVTIFRENFIEELKQQGESENEAIGEDVFDIPWNRGGGYLDILEKEQDLTIGNVVAKIPFPLITKSNIACGSICTHTFMIIKEKPVNWADLKIKIQNEYHHKDFIVQEYFNDPNNLLIKGMSFFGEFSVSLRDGFGEAYQSSNSGCFVSYDVHNHKRTLPNKDDQIPQEIFEYIKKFQLNLAQNLKLDIMGIDFLYDSDKKKVYPIDLNKMPRPENIENFKEILLRNLKKTIE